MNAIAKMLPWRVQTALGYRPNGIIDAKAIETYPGVRAIKKHHPAHISSIVMPVHVEEKLPPSFFAVTMEGVNTQCVDFLVCEMGQAEMLDEQNLITIIKDNKVFAPLSYEQGRVGEHRALSIPEYPVKKSLKGKTLVLSTTGAKDNYYHWTVDMVQKIGFAQDCGYRFADMDHILLNKAIYPFQKQIIELLNIPTEKIVETSMGDYYECENMIVPQHVPHSVFGYQFIRSSILDKISKEPKAGSPRRIYCSRRTTGTGRCVENEAELTTLLKAYGFETVYFEDYTVLQQAEMVHSCDVILSPHGAGLVNTFFARPGTKLVELMNEDHPSLHFWLYGIYGGLNYGTMMCRPTGNNPRDHMKNIIADTAKLQRLLEKMDIAKI